MKKTIFWSLGIVLAISACSGSQKSTSKEATAVTKAAEPILTKAESNALAAGKSINEQYCGGCHALKKIENYTSTQLETIVPNMVKKTNKKAGAEVINPEQQEKLAKYLNSICKK